MVVFLAVFQEGKEKKIRVGLETKNVLDYQGRAGSTSIVQWTLRPVIFGVIKCKFPSLNFVKEFPAFSWLKLAKVGSKSAKIG